MKHFDLVKKVMAAGSMALAACTFSSSVLAKDAEFTLTYAHSAETKHPWHPASLKFVKEVEEKSNGRIKFSSLFTAGEMGSEREMAEAVQQGTLDVILIASMGMSSFDKNLMLFDFPYLFPDFETAYKALDGEPGSLMAQSLEKKGFHVLAYLENDYRGFSNSKRPIHHPSDLSGLKLRVPASPVLAEWMKSVNCDPTIMPYNEVYSAIQTGVVDGQDNGILLSYTHKIFEVNKYYSLTNHIYCPSPIMISSKVWKSMPEDLQKILTDAAVDTRDYQRKLNVEYREKYENSAKNDGIQINDLSADELKEFVESASKVWPKFADEIDKNIYDSMMKTIGKAE